MGWICNEVAIMPIYEYECKACGHNFDALQKVSDGPLKKCPECEKSQLQKLVSAPSFKLSGTGWYETDFKTKKKSDTKNPEDAKKTDSTKTETKPEPKKEAKSDKKETKSES